MSSGRVFSPELIDRLTNPRGLAITAMIKPEILTLTIPLIMPMGRGQDASLSSWGELSAFPEEIKHLILNHLDFQSMIRLSRVSFKAKKLVESHIGYNELKHYIPDILIAMGETKTLRYHSCQLLRQTLRSERCESCHLEYAPFLYIPTCERICYHCLHDCLGLRLIELEHAKTCFNLTAADLAHVPVFRSLPGTLRFMSESRYRLIALKQAMRTAIKVHGSTQNIIKIFPPDTPENMNIHDHWQCMWYLHNVDPDVPPSVESRRPDKMPFVEEDYAGAAAIRMPSLVEGTLSHGRFCKGCTITQRHYLTNDLPKGPLKRLFPKGVEGERQPLVSLVSQLYSEEGFLEHIKSCYGVKELLSGGERF